MMFSNFKYEKPEEFPQLDVGDYFCRIESAVDKTSQTGNVFVEITVSIQGHANANPSKMFYYDIPKEGDAKANGDTVSADDVKKARQKLSRLLDAFNIPAAQVSNLASWKGKTGMVHCDWQYDPKEADHKSKKYKALFPKLQDKKEPMPEQTTQQEGFQEDIPF